MSCQYISDSLDTRRNTPYRETQTCSKILLIIIPLNEKVTVRIYSCNEWCVVTTGLLRLKIKGSESLPFPSRKTTFELPPKLLRKENDTKKKWNKRKFSGLRNFKICIILRCFKYILFYFIFFLIGKSNIRKSFLWISNATLRKSGRYIN